MITELLIICVTICILFGPYLNAKADIVREMARRMEIDNDQKELDLHSPPLLSETSEFLETK